MPELSKLEQQAFNYLMANEAKYIKQIQKQLVSALTSIYGEMKKIYDKYAVKGILTRAEMTRYNKYTTMEKQILLLLDPAIKANIKTIAQLLPDQFNQSFFHYAWTIDNASGLRLSWGLIDTKQLLGAFDITNPKNIELQEALRNYPIESKRLIRSALLNGLTLGKSFDQMARDLRQVVEKKIYWKALRIVRTEGMRSINSGQYLAYIRARENGIRGNDIWSAAKDIRTRADHRSADGQRRGQIIEGAFSIGGETALYPLDLNLSAGNSINCRCHLRFEIDGYSPILMRTRAEGVIPYQKFDDYAKEYHPDWIKEK